MQKTYEYSYIWTNYLIRLVGFQNRHHHCVLLKKWVLMIYNMPYSVKVAFGLHNHYHSQIQIEKQCRKHMNTSIFVQIT